MQTKISILSALLIFSAVVSLRAADLSDLSYEVNGDAVTITDCDTEATGTLVIPGTIEDRPVTHIGNLAFFQCAGLTNITIPESVTSIGFAAFSGCAGLTSITIPDNVTNIANRGLSPRR